jgi:hypothetical protein
LSPILFHPPLTHLPVVPRFLTPTSSPSPPSSYLAPSPFPFSPFPGTTSSPPSAGPPTFGSGDEMSEGLGGLRSWCVVQGFVEGANTKIRSAARFNFGFDMLTSTSTTLVR